ncbi:MAG: hypothetical protein AAFY82_01060 [Pseudomonadota bacterium]
MKPRNLLNLPASVQAMFTHEDRNVQELTEDRPVSVPVIADRAEAAARPHVLARRMARHNRRIAH